MCLGNISQAKTCLISLLKDQNEINLLNQELKKYQIPDGKIELKIFVHNIKECLESDYDVVIIIAHSAIIDTKSKIISALTYISNDSVNFIPDQIFKKVKMNKKIKKIGISTCYSEFLLQNYPNLKSIQERGVDIQFAPVSIYKEVDAVKYSLRSFAESAKFVYDYSI